MENPNVSLYDIKKTFLQELYIYTIALCLKTKDYESLEYLINRSYLKKSFDRRHEDFGFVIFYHYSDLIDSEKKRIDNKNYYSGTAQYWIDNIAIDYCGKQDFVFADALLCNYAFFGANYGCEWIWFPQTYTYGASSVIDTLSYHLRTKEYANIWSKIFGYDNLDSFISKISNVMEELKTNGNIIPRHNMSFEDAPLFSDYINPDGIGSMR